MTTLEEQASSVFGRIATLGAAYRIDVQTLLDKLVLVSEEVAAFVMVAVPHTFDRIAAATPIRRGGEVLDRIATLSQAADPDQLARFEQLAATDTRDHYAELEHGPDGFAFALQAFGNRKLDTDLTRLAAVGAGTTGAREVAVLLGGEDNLVGVTDRSGGTWTLQIRQRNRDDRERAATRERVAAAGAALGVTQAQINVATALHDSLAKDNDSYAFLRLGKSGLSRELGITWGGVAWEHVVRMMLGFYPGGDTAARLGELSGAFGAQVAAAVELTLLPTEPPRMRVAATLTKGLP
jgi:hypothetical protein